MARSWQAPQLLVVILVALVAVTYPSRRKTFLSVREVPASEIYVPPTLEFVTSEFNKQSDDQYSFRIARVLNVRKLVSELPSCVLATPLCQGTWAPCSKPMQGRAGHVEGNKPTGGAEAT